MPDLYLTTTDGKSYPIRFTQNSLYKMEQLTGKSLDEMGGLECPECRDVAGKEATDISGRRECLICKGTGVSRMAMPHLTIMQTLAYACLEGARIRNKSKRPPYTIEETGEIIDAAGGYGVVTPIVMQAFRDAYPERYKSEEAKNAPPAATENQPPVEAGATGS